MKKIGIMTWFLNNNYGSSLQAFSLEKAIEKLEYEVNIINYSPDSYGIRDVMTIKAFRKKIHKKLFFKRIVFKDGFDSFRANNLSISKKVTTYPELRNLNSDYDVFICGSDQIWSPLSFNEKYYLNFADSNKIVSYAPSFGVLEIKDEIIKNKMRNLISRFNYLSVREIKGQKIVNDLTGKEAEIVLDPTLLLDSNTWHSLTSNIKSERINSNYILCYFLGKSNRHYKKIVAFAKVNNLEIINIPVFKKQLLNKYNVNNVDSLEFVNLIKNAKCVFTDSYHGTIFSINLNVPFLAFKRFKDNDVRSENSRLDSIFKLLNIDNNLFVYELKENNIPKIDFDKINSELNKYREKSLNYLKNSIENVNNLEIDNKYNITDCCTGCGACKNICPKGAIEVREDEYGFQRSFIDENKCVNCGLCRKVCPMLNLNFKNINDMKHLYSFKSKDNKVLASSSSGGFSYTLSLFLNNEYYVCGCYYDKTRKSAIHILIEPNKTEDLTKLQGSKYIQSETTDVFKEILSLSEDKKVVFFGTPCQVAGLEALLKLKKRRENVLLVELICHGVPSKILWNKYLKEISEKYNLDESNISVKFRDKKYGWSHKSITLSDSKKEISIDETKDNFYKMFNKRYINNYSCYECPYRYNSTADIKIGDYWGEKFKEDPTGVSMIISMTEKGEEIIAELKDSENVQINIEKNDDYFKCQNLSNPTEPIFKDKILNDIKKGESLELIAKKYSGCEKVLKLTKPIKKIIKKMKK